MTALKLLDGVKADATLSPCRKYRYSLHRDWFPKSGNGSVLWIMLNPSTADADEDDPTIRKCQKFARTWGYDGIIVVNLFAYRTPHPEDLRMVDAVGPGNDAVLAAFFGAESVGLVVAAWGAYSHLRNRDAAVIALAGRVHRPLHALKLTKNGKPWHPLYVPNGTEPVVFREPAVERGTDG